LQHTTEATQKMLVQELRQPFFGGLTFQENEKHLDLTQNSRKILKDWWKRKQSSSGDHHDLLNMLLSAKYEDGFKMDENQLVDEILILFAAVMKQLQMHLLLPAIVVKSCSTVKKSI
jgi:cytochrome P450